MRIPIAVSARRSLRPAITIIFAVAIGVLVLVFIVLSTKSSPSSGLSDELCRLDVTALCNTCMSLGKSAPECTLPMDFGNRKCVGDVSDGEAIPCERFGITLPIGSSSQQ